MKNIVKLSTLLIVLLVSTTTASATVIWDETSQGDINGTNVGDLVDGTNTILGSGSFTRIGTTSTPDFDQFTVTVPTDFTIDRIIYRLTSIDNQGAGSVSVQVASKIPLTTWVWSSLINIEAANINIDNVLFDALLPSSQTSLYLAPGFNWGGAGDFGISWTWEFEIQATDNTQAPQNPVPEPTTLALLALGLAGLGFSRKRKA